MGHCGLSGDGSLAAPKLYYRGHFFGSSGVGAKPPKPQKRRKRKKKKRKEKRGGERGGAVLSSKANIYCCRERLVYV